MISRRDFLKTAAGAALVPAVLHGAEMTDGAASDPLLAELVRANDEHVRALLVRQERRANHPHRGGLPNEYGIYTPHDAAGFISALVCARVSPRSQYFQGAGLVEPLRAAATFLRRCQHPDGTIDLYSTNFHSTPDLGFVLEVIGPAAQLLRSANRPEDAALQEELKGFIIRGGEALSTGGIHTPNHRWVVSSALAWVNSLYPDGRYVARANQWLEEGIDVDPDGQFTEKSTSVYSPIVDRALITVGRLLNRPELFEPVRRNLEMTLYYVHPDGEVVTEASTRQDKYTRGSMARYYYAYRFMARRDGNGRFAAMARQIERSAQGKLAGELPAFLTDPELRRPLPAAAPLPTDYVKVFSHSNLARIRHGQVSATVLAGNSTLFSLRKGGAALEAVRLASAFFGKGQFVGEQLETRDGAYVLRQTLEGPYFQPVPKDRLTTEHVKMEANGTLKVVPRSERAQSNVQRLQSLVTVREAEGGYRLEFDLRGTEGVPVAVELAFRAGGRLVGVEPVAHVKDAHLLRSGMGRYEAEGQTIEFGPGRAEHSWTQLRGAAPKWEGDSVYVTGFTPFQATIFVR